MQVHLIDINVSAEIDENPSLRFQDIWKKPKCRGWTHGRIDNVKTVYPTTNKVCMGYYEYLQSIFLSRNKKNNAYPCKPQFYFIKVGFKGVKII